MRKLLDWLKGLFGKKKPPAPAPAPAPTPVPTFVADFSTGTLNLNDWVVSTWTAPGNNATNKGVFSAEHVFFDGGALCFALTQVKQPDGTFLSTGSEIATKRQFQYGTFEWVMRASSTAGTPTQAGSVASGAISGCFVYRTAAQTEIDVEVESNERSNLTQFTSWVGESNPNQTTAVSQTTWEPHEAFFTYKIKWMPGKIEFYRDNVLVATHTKVVPTLAAAVMINHWGTNNPNWGGVASPNVTRYMWVKSFKYTPL